MKRIQKDTHSKMQEKTKGGKITQVRKNVEE